MPPRRSKQKSQHDQDQDITLATINATLVQVLAEVKKTNGRVTAIEIWKNKVQGGYAAIVAVCTFLGVVIGIMVTFFVR
jgi:hypothetical protein